MQRFVYLAFFLWGTHVAAVDLRATWRKFRVGRAKISAPVLNFRVAQPTARLDSGPLAAIPSFLSPMSEGPRVRGPLADGPMVTIPMASDPIASAPELSVVDPDLRVDAPEPRIYSVSPEDAATDATAFELLATDVRTSEFPEAGSPPALVPGRRTTPLFQAARRLDIRPEAERWEAARAFRVEVYRTLRDKYLSHDERVETLTRLRRSMGLFEALNPFQTESVIHRHRLDSIKALVILVREKGTFHHLFDVPDLRENLLTQFDPAAIYLRHGLRLHAHFMELIDQIGRSDNPDAKDFLRDAFLYLFAMHKMLEIAPGVVDQSLLKNVVYAIKTQDPGHPEFVVPPETVEDYYLKRAHYRILERVEEVLRKLAGYGIRAPEGVRNPGIWEQAAQFGRVVETVQRLDPRLRLSETTGKALATRIVYDDCVSKLLGALPEEFRGPPGG